MRVVGEVEKEKEVNEEKKSKHNRDFSHQLFSPVDVMTCCPMSAVKRRRGRRENKRGKERKGHEKGK